MSNTMTMREFLMAIANIENIDKTLTEKALEEIKKLDEKNAKKKNSLSKTQLENIELKEKLIATMETNRVYVASEIATLMEISTQKGSALLKQLVAENKCNVEDIKVKGKGTLKGYTLA